MSKILIVEDDSSINDMLVTSLKKEGYDCVSAYSGTEALLRVDAEKYDLIILDLMLPGVTGDEVIKRAREKGKTPIIVLSARDTIDVKVEMLKLGANDYMTKPFDLKELTARVFVLLRDFDSDKSSETDMTYGELILNDEKKSLVVSDNVISLTAQEYKIMHLFMKNPGRVFSKNEIYEYAWDDIFIGEDKTVNVHISNLRKKIKKYTEIDYIETLWGLGFKLKEQS